MADINVTPGTGKTVATETIAGREFQYVKLVDGTAASTTTTGVAANPLQVSLANTASNATAVKVDISAITAAVTSPVGVVGTIAHDAADSGNPVKVGAQARTTNPTAVADADRSNLITDKLGKLVTVSAIRDLKGIQTTTITSSTSETTIVTAVASTFLDIYRLIISNTSATACNVTIKDSTAGTTRYIFAVPAGTTCGFSCDAGSAVPQATVNNNWTATCSASVASIVITAEYVKNI